MPTAAVTIVTVQPSYRRRGLLTGMMKHQLERIAEAGVEPVALLWASETLIYGRFGYGHAAPRARLTGQTRSTAFLPTIDLGRGSVGEVDRDDAVPVRSGETRRDLRGELERVGDGERPRETLAQRFAFEELGDEVRRAVVGADVEDREKVRMIQRAGGAGFLLEAAEACLVAVHRGGQDFNRDVAAEARVARAVDLAHPALAERFEHLVRPQTCPRRDGHATSIRCGSESRESVRIGSAEKCVSSSRARRPDRRDSPGAPE